MNGTEEIVWYAMRVTYRRELDVKEVLDKELIESFIPMHYVLRTKHGRKKRVLEPVVHNLLFVHTTPSVVREVKSRIPHLQYMMRTTDDRRMPIIVPEGQMKHFISVAGTYDEQLLFLDPCELNLAKGTKVRIRGGVFDGREGIYMKIKGARDKRVVVAVPGVIAVAVATLHTSQVEPIEE